VKRLLMVEKHIAGAICEAFLLTIKDGDLRGYSCAPFTGSPFSYTLRGLTALVEHQRDRLSANPMLAELDFSDNPLGLRHFWSNLFRRPMPVAV